MSFHERAPPTDEGPIEQESTGPVASDSLAAESIEEGGAFGENKNASVMGVKGDSSTLANEDTSGVTKLDAAPDAPTRDEEAESTKAYPDDASKPTLTGTHSTDGGYVGGPTYGSTDDSTTSTSTATATATDSSSSDTAITTGPPTGSGARPYVDSAPNYTGIVTGAIHRAGDDKPAGDILIDAGADGADSMPETKTFTGAVGGPNDPGRLAEQKMFRDNAALAGEGVGGVRQSDLEGEGSGAYDALNSSERA